MSITIDFPEGLNGIIEAGIAAGTDVFSDSGFGVKIVLRCQDVTPILKIKDALLEGTKRAKARSGLSSELTDLLLKALNHFGSYEKVFHGSDEEVTRRLERPSEEIDVSATLCLMDLTALSTNAAKVFQTMVTTVCRKGWVLRELGGTVHRFVRYRDIASKKIPLVRGKKEVEEVGFADWQLVVTLIMAAKVNWWKINHHVGTDPKAPVGYVHKVLVSSRLVEETDYKTIRNVIWSVSKLIPTRPFLTCWNVPNLLGQEALYNGRSEETFGPISVAMAEDLRLRVVSNPAGTAASVSHMEIARRAGKSPFGLFVPFLANFSAVELDLVNVYADPAKYHMGSMFLTGCDRKTCAKFDEEEIECLAGFIYATSDGSMMSKAKVIKPKEEVTSNMTFLGITTLKAELMTIGSKKVTREIVLAKMGGNTDGGFALQYGYITTQDVSDAKEAAKKAEEEEAAKKAEKAGTSATA
jgi:hypothetical protein